MSDVTTGKNSKFSYGDGATPEVWTEIADATGFAGPGLSRETHDATNSASPDDYREIIGGLKDGGEYTIDLDFVPGSTGLDTLLAHFESNALVNYRITYPNGHTWTAAALITALDPNAPIDDKMTIPATFKVSGKPVLAAAA